MARMTRRIHRTGCRRLACLWAVVISFCFSIVNVYPVEYFRPKVAIIDVLRGSGVSELEAANVKKEFLKQFKRSSRFDLLPQQEIFRILNSGNDLLDKERELLETARTRYEDFERFYKQGKELYLNSRFQEAISEFAEASRALLDAAVILDDNSRWVEIAIYMGVCYSFLGKDKEASIAYGTALFINPTYRLDATQFPPEIVRLFEDLRQQFLRRERRTLIAEVKPEGVQLVINGKVHPNSVQGKVTIGGLFKGPYLLVVKKRGYTTKRIEITVEKPVERVALELQPLERPRMNVVELLRPFPNDEGLDRARLKAIESFAIQHGLEMVLLSFVAKGGREGMFRISAQLYDRRNSFLSTMIEKQISAPSYESAVMSIVKELERYLDVDGYVTLTPAQESTTPLERELERDYQERPFYTKWWFWTIIGAGVVGGGVASYFLVLQGDDLVRFRVRSGG